MVAVTPRRPCPPQAKLRQSPLPEFDTLVICQQDFLDN